MEYKESLCWCIQEVFSANAQTAWFLFPVPRLSYTRSQSAGMLGQYVLQDPPVPKVNRLKNWIQDLCSALVTLYSRALDGVGFRR